MPNLSEESIIKTYKELVRERGDKAIGEGIFMRETGISKYHWKGGYWRTWSAFQADAGYAPNAPTEKFPTIHSFFALQN